MEERILQVNDVIIGSNIKKLRLKKGLKQIDVIAKLQLENVDITSFSYSRIENGQQNPKVSFLIGIVKVLECDFNDLFKK